MIIIILSEGTQFSITRLCNVRSQGLVQRNYIMPSD